LLLALDHSGAGATEGIQHTVVRARTKAPEVCAHQMGRVGEDKAIPLVNRAIVGRKPVQIRVGEPSIGTNDGNTVHFDLHGAGPFGPFDEAH